MRSFRFQLAARFTLAMAAAVAVISVVSVLTLRALLDRELNAGILNVASIQAASLVDAPDGGMEFHEWQLTPTEAASVRDLIQYAQVWSEGGRSLLRRPRVNWCGGSSGSTASTSDPSTTHWGGSAPPTTGTSCRWRPRSRLVTRWWSA